MGVRRGENEGCPRPRAETRRSTTGKDGEAATANARLEPMRYARSARSVTGSHVARTCSIATQTARGTSEEAAPRISDKNVCQNSFKPICLNRLKGISGEARATDRQVNRSISKRQANFRSKKLGYIGVISHLAARFASRITRDRPPHTPPSSTRAATRTSSLDSNARRFPERPADAFRDRDARRSRVNSCRPSEETDGHHGGRGRQDLRVQLRDER